MSAAPTTCGRARRLLWPDGGPRAATPEVIAARSHVAACAACRTFLRDMDALRDVVGALAPSERAPDEVRRRVLGAVARRGRRSHGGAIRRAAGALLVAAGLLLASLQLRRARDPLSVVARDHARAAAATVVAVESRADVGRWLANRVRFAIAVPVLPGGTLRRARVYELAGRRGAAFDYDVGGVPLTYVVVPADEPPDGSSARMHHTRRSGLGVVSWRTPGLLHVLVGDFGDAELAALAKACAAVGRAPQA